MNSTFLASLPTTQDISEALWVVGRDYGREWEVDEQVAIARQLRAYEAVTGKFPTHKEIKAAFERFGVRYPARGYGQAVHARLVRLYGPVTRREPRG